MDDPVPNLTPEEIEDSIRRLEQDGLIRRDGPAVRLTSYGKLMAELTLRTDPATVRFILTMARRRVNNLTDRTIIARVATVLLKEVAAAPRLPSYWADALAVFSLRHPDVARVVGQIILDLCVDDGMALVAGRAITDYAREIGVIRGDDR